MAVRILGHVKAAFLLAFFIGGGAILCAPFLGQKESLEMRVGIPISIALTLMLLYGVFIWLRSRTPYGSDADADSFYYLGFIYTLISLTSQLIPQMFPALLPDKPQLAGEQLLGIFGLGLLTTFLGLAGRIAFLSFAPEPTEDLDGSFHRLAETFDRVGSDIESRIRRTSDGIEDLGRSMRAVGEEIQQTLRTATQRTLQELTQTQEQARQSNIAAMVQFKSSMESILNETSKRLQGISGALTETASSITVSGKAIDTALSDSALKVRDNFSRAIEAACESIQAGARESSKSLQSALGDVQVTVQNANTNFNELAATTLVASKALAEVTSQLTGSSQKLQTVASIATTQAESAQKRIVDLGTQVNTVQSALTDNMSKLGTQGISLEKQLGDLTARLQTLSSNLATIISAQPVLLKAFDDLQEHIDDIASDAERQLATIRGHRQALEDELTESRSAVTKVHRELVGAVDHIKRELG